jgi:conjugal transfer pilus assembly protein TraV
MSRLLSSLEHHRLATAIAKKSRLRLNVARPALTEAQATLLWKAVCSKSAYGVSVLKTSPQLGTAQVAQFRRVLLRQSDQLLDCAVGAVSLAEAQAIWAMAKSISPGGARRDRPGTERCHRAAASAVAMLSVLPLAACATLLGGNVKGNFSCSAPGGTCAPSTVIDDAALAMIQNARPMTPAARPWSQPPMRGDGKVMAANNGMVHRDRRILKVVFPSFVDQRGYLHEARVVHAVADPGGWMQLAHSGNTLTAQVVKPPAQTMAMKTDDASTSSAIAVSPFDGLSFEQASGPAKRETSLTDHNAPDPAKVAAARERGLARLPTMPSEIKAAVDGRLGVKPAPTPVADLADAPVAIASDTRPDPSAAVAKGGVAGQGTDTDPAEMPPAANAPTSFPGRVEER